MTEPNSRNYDGFLADRIDDMVTGLFSVPITIALPGLLVTGVPIKESEYFGNVGEVMRRGFLEAADYFDTNLLNEDVENKEQMIARLQQIAERQITLFSEFGAEVDQHVQERSNLRSNDDSTEDEAVEDTVSPRGFLYLKNVVIFGTHPDGIRMQYFRIAMESVAGWGFGQIELD